MNALWTERDLAVAEIARRFVTHPWPTEFLLIVDPLVTWIWLGALIIGGGGLIALWPVPTLARRRAAVASSAARPSAPPAASPCASRCEMSGPARVPDRAGRPRRAGACS